MKYTRSQILNTIEYWKNKLNEVENSFIDGFEIKVYTESNEISQLIDSVIKMVIKTYEPIGGYYGNTNSDRLKRTTSMVKAVYDKSNKIVSCSFYRNVNGSFKIQAYANDQTDLGKNATKAIIHDDVNNYKMWIWGEVSMGVEKYFKKYEGYPLPNEFVQDALEKPDGIQLSQDGFHYKRIIGKNAEPDEKVIFGFKDKETFDAVSKLADYEMLRQKFNLNALNENVEDDFTIKTFKGACSFINQLSDLYDEENLCQLTPGLSSMLDQSISILKDNVNAEKWVAKTLEDAEYLRNNISTITLFKNTL